MKHSSNRSKHDLTLKLSVVLLWCILSFSRPRNGGRFCVGRRMKFRSCNTEPCPRGRKDFREEQCSQFDGKHFNINGLPPTVRWVPKYSGSEYTDVIPKTCNLNVLRCDWAVTSEMDTIYIHLYNAVWSQWYGMFGAFSFTTACQPVFVRTQLFTIFMILQFHVQVHIVCRRDVEVNCDVDV